MRQTPHLGSVETTSAIVWSGMNGQMTSVIMWITPLLAWMSNFFKRFPFTVTKPWRNMLVSQEDYQSRKTNVVVVGLEVDVHSVDAPFHRGNHLQFHFNFSIFYFIAPLWEPPCRCRSCHWSPLQRPRGTEEPWIHHFYAIRRAFGSSQHQII